MTQLSREMEIQRRSETSGAIWQQLPSGRVTHRFESVVLIAVLALIPVLIIENDAKSQKWQDIAFGANWLIWAVFALELAFILIVAPRKGAALRAHWVDALLATALTQPRRERCELLLGAALAPPPPPHSPGAWRLRSAGARRSLAARFAA